MKSNPIAKRFGHFPGQIQVLIEWGFKKQETSREMLRNLGGEPLD
jgi:hypothetical protein